MIFFLLLSFVLALLGLVFALQNADPVTVSFLFGSFDSSLAIVLVAALLAGAAIALLAVLPSLTRASWQAGARGKRLAKLEAQLSETSSESQSGETSAGTDS